MSLNLSMLFDALARPPKPFNPPRDIADAEARTLAAVRQLGALRGDDPARIDVMREITDLARFLNVVLVPPSKKEPNAPDAAPAAKSGEWLPRFTDERTESAFQAMLKKLAPANRIAFRAALRSHADAEQAKEPIVKLLLTGNCLSDALNDCIEPLDRAIMEGLIKGISPTEATELLLREQNFRAAGAALASTLTIY